MKSALFRNGAALPNESEMSSFRPFYQAHRRTQWHPTPVLLPGKSHGWRSLEGCSPWGREESDTTERLHFHFSLSCIGEGNGNPLQCFCLENPRDGRAAVSGVAQSRTRLKRLSSSSSIRHTPTSQSTVTMSEASGRERDRPLPCPTVFPRVTGQLRSRRGW